MFTGIVEELGKLAWSDGRRLRIAASFAGELSPGESVAVNGCCLTVLVAGPGYFEAELLDETRLLTNLSNVAVGDHVNLERALSLGGRLGGHVVLGHVDGKVKVLRPAPHLCVELPKKLAPYVAWKGSVALDGVSLTVAGLSEGFFEVELTEHTCQATTLGRRQVGEELNVEVDVIARYLERLLSEGISARPGGGG
jgi:riboflavin synthase